MADTKTRYVLGFLFDNNVVVLIRKNRPAWQKGLLNGVGGHIEPGETPLQAMVREFREETGATVENWRHFATMCGDGFEVVCFFADGNALVCRTATDEEVALMFKPTILAAGCIDNVPWLIEMAQSMRRLDHPVDHFRVEYVRPAEVRA